MLNDSVAVCGHVLVVGKVSDAAYVAATTKYLNELCQAGAANEAAELLTHGLIRSNDADEYSLAQDPEGIRRYTEAELAERVADKLAKLIGSVVYPHEMTTWNTQYAQRPKLVVSALRQVQLSIGVRPTMAYAVSVDGVMWSTP